MKQSLILLVLVQIFGIYSGQRVAPGVPPQQYQHQMPQHQVHQQQQQHMPPQHQQVPMHQQQQPQQMHQAPVHQQPPPQQQQQMHNPNMQQQMHQAAPVHQQPQGHHGHHAPGQILNAANIAHEKDHIAEHMEVPMDTSKMSEQELQFHYFKMHDADNNNKLDGCELIKSLIHWHVNNPTNHPHQMNHALNNQNPNLVKPNQGVSGGDHGGQQGQIVTVNRINDLVREIDSTVQLDEEVEDTLLQMTDDFVDQVVGGAVMLAKHRHSSNSIEVKDVELYLERAFNMWIPGFGTDELRPYKRSSLTEAHKQRVGLIRRTIRK